MRLRAPAAVIGLNTSNSLRSKLRGLRLYLLLAGLALPSWAGRRVQPPPPQELLRRALSSELSYSARGRVQAFPRSGKARSQAVSVLAAPGGKKRRELASSAKKPASLLQISDGRRQALLFVKRDKLWTGPAAGADELGAIRASFELSVSTGGRVARRSTWRLDFRAKAGGALRRSWWVDRKTGVPLRREAYRPDGTLARRERWSRFEPGSVPADAFALPASSAALAWAEWGEPSWRPDGFVPVERREAGGSRIWGYGDGYASFTVVSAPAGAAPPLPGRAARKAGPGRMAETDDGLALAWRCGARSCLIVGDLLEDELLLVAGSMREAR